MSFFIEKIGGDVIAVGEELHAAMTAARDVIVGDPHVQVVDVTEEGTSVLYAGQWSLLDIAERNGCMELITS